MVKGKEKVVKGKENVVKGKENEGERKGGKGKGNPRSFNKSERAGIVVLKSGDFRQKLSGERLQRL